MTVNLYFKFQSTEAGGVGGAAVVEGVGAGR